MKLFRTTYVFIEDCDNISVSFFDIGLRITLDNYSSGECDECEWETLVDRELEEVFRTNPQDFIKYLRNTKQCAKYSDLQRDCVLAILERGFAS